MAMTKIRKVKSFEKATHVLIMEDGPYMAEVCTGEFLEILSDDVGPNLFSVRNEEGDIYYLHKTPMRKNMYMFFKMTVQE